jgi:hypothetical protein
MTSSRGEGPTRWVRRKASDRGISSPPHDGCCPLYRRKRRAPTDSTRVFTFLITLCNHGWNHAI